MKNVLDYVQHVLKNNYPLRVELDELTDLSHLYVLLFNPQKFSAVEFDLAGVILNGPFTGYKIVKVVTTKTLTWHTYLCALTSLLNKCWFPCNDETTFLFFAHFANLVPSLHLKKLILKNKTETVEHKVEYVYRKEYCFSPAKYLLLKHAARLNDRFIFLKTEPSRLPFENHFYFDDFSVSTNHKKLKTEIDRLIRGRDKYKTIHFHLDNNTGGDIVPAHIILRCLTGRKEPWMKSITKMTQNETYTWDCWREESEDSPNYTVVQKLNLAELPSYDTKYSGKVMLHTTKDNGSAAWFFVTYLIYAFAEKITRFSKKCYGQTVKYGKVHASERFQLVGHSGTTSGDGNNKLIVKEGVVIKCPTDQFIASSIKPNDWNRFWVGDI